MQESTANLLANSGVHFAILLGFWYVLYEKMAFKIARSAFRDQLASPTLSLASAADLRYPILRDLRSDQIAQQREALSAAGQAQNADAMRKIMYVIAGVCFVLLLLPRLTGQKIQWSHIFKENAITYLFVGVIEACFFLKVAQHYVPVPPSKLETDLFSEVKRRVGC